MPGAGGRITVVRLSRRAGMSTRALRAVVGHVLRRERCPAGMEVSVALVSDAVIRRLNRRYLRRDRPTDVLAFPLAPHALNQSFPSGSGRGGNRFLGEVIISADRARVQARSAGHGLKTELALLAVHGVLHLLGYDDRSRRAAAVMVRRQRRLVSEAGFEVRG